MTKLILIWLFQKFTYVAEAVKPSLLGVTICLMVVATALTIVYLIEDGLDVKIKDVIGVYIKKLFKFSILTLCLTFGALAIKAVRLNDTEYKAAIVYCLGEEIIKSPIGEKSIDIVDAKLQNWLDMINQSNINANTKKDEK